MGLTLCQENKMNIPNKSQEGRVLQVLKEAKGDWVSKRFFVQNMMLSQAGRAIFNLENDPKWWKEYPNMRIEHSDFRDEFKFISYRLVPVNKETLF